MSIAGALFVTLVATLPSPPVLELTSAAELVVPGVASSEFSEVRLAVSPDGKTMLWGSKDRPGGAGDYDIWISRRSDAAWSAPQPAPFSTSSRDYDPAYSPDGRWVYFFSDRPGGPGKDDIFRVAVIADGFGVPERLGSEVNSPGSEWAPGISPDGKTLLFASDGRGGAGRQDLFVATLEGVDATFLADGTSLVFTRSPDVYNDPVELYFAALGEAGYDAGVILPTSINAGDATFGPAIDWADRSVLYFTGHRPEASVGKLDLYRVRVRVKR